MMQVAIGMDDTRKKKRKHPGKKHGHAYRKSVGDELDVVEGDKVTKTSSDENKNRRTLILEKGESNSWGFTIQTYGIHHKSKDEVELLTYVDYVAHNSPAFYAGMRAGDVILSINGTNMEDADHLSLIAFIKSCTTMMRVVVLFEDCCKKVDLHLRYLKLKRVLAEKVFELRSLEQQEMRVLSGLSRFDSCRSSRASSNSSTSYWDDRLSLIPELDRCPSPRPSPGRHHDSFPHSETSASPSSSRKSFSPRFDYERSYLPVSLHRPHSLAASVSVHAALNSSLRNSAESLPTSPASPIFNFSSSAIQEHSVDDSFASEFRRSNNSLKNTDGHFPFTSTPNNSLIKPGRSLRHSGRHSSAPDELSIKSHSFHKPIPLLRPRVNEPQEMELDMFKIQVGGAVVDESTTESPVATLTRPSKLKSYPHANCDFNNESQVSQSENPKSAIYLKGECHNCHFPDDLSNNSFQHDDLPSCETSDTSDKSSAISSDRESSLPDHRSPVAGDIPAIQIDFINEEDAVSYM